jgi:feruloyl esterase
VEQGRKPTRIIASRVVNGRIERTRPLCPFGLVAWFSGCGSTDDAANFTCAAPAGR